MRSRSRELLDRSVSAMTAAIEVFNKPTFPYRGETFAVLAINAWELLLKARWLKDHNNRSQCLYVKDRRTLSSGKTSKKLYIRRTRSGNPFTHGLDFLGRRLLEQKALDTSCWRNVEALVEIRDSAVHFYNQSPTFAVRLQEVGAASVRNYVFTARSWFGVSPQRLGSLVLPLSFLELPTEYDSVVLNPEEKNFLRFLDELEHQQEGASDNCAVSLNLDVHVVGSKMKDAIGIRVSAERDAVKVALDDEQIRAIFPWTYDRLTDICRERYSGFKVNQKYHGIRKKLAADPQLAHVRYLEPGNPKSSQKSLFSQRILVELDRHYSKIS